MENDEARQCEIGHYIYGLHCTEPAKHGWGYGSIIDVCDIHAKWNPFMVSGGKCPDCGKLADHYPCLEKIKLFQITSNWVAARQGNWEGRVQITGRIIARSEEDAADIYVRELTAGSELYELVGINDLLIESIAEMHDYTKHCANGDVISLDVGLLPSDFTYFVFREEY